MSRPQSYLLLIALLALPLPGTAQSNPPQPPVGKEIERLIEQLGSDRFREREAASRDLGRIGVPALTALRQATHRRDLEIRRRAADLVVLIMDRARDGERAALQGFWVLKTTEYLGEKADQDPTDRDEIDNLISSRERERAEERELAVDYTSRRTTLEFKGNTYEYRQWIHPWSTESREEGYVRSTKGIYRLDVDRNPKVLEKEWIDPVHESLQTSSCIYVVCGDTLQMCVNLNEDKPKKLPTRFVTDRDEDIVLLRFQRAKK